MAALVVIPARYASTRFPGKVLARLGEKPIVQHVYEGVRRARRVDRVIVATDDRRVAGVVRAFGGEVVLTSPTHQCGTERVAEVVAGLTDPTVEFIVNVQGDEPLIRPEMVDAVVEALVTNPTTPVATLRHPITDPSALRSPHVVKVVTDRDGYAVAFSRAVPPGGGPWYRHLGVYAYRREFLPLFVSWAPSAGEHAQRLEQLRILEHGARIAVRDSPWDSVGVDTPEDVERVRALLGLPAGAQGRDT